MQYFINLKPWWKLSRRARSWAGPCVLGLTWAGEERRNCLRWGMWMKVGKKMPGQEVVRRPPWAGLCVLLHEQTAEGLCVHLWGWPAGTWAQHSELFSANVAIHMAIVGHVTEDFWSWAKNFRLDGLRQREIADVFCFCFNKLYFLEQSLIYRKFEKIVQSFHSPDTQFSLWVTSYIYVILLS